MQGCHITHGICSDMDSCSTSFGLSHVANQTLGLTLFYLAALPEGHIGYDTYFLNDCNKQFAFATFRGTIIISSFLAKDRFSHVPSVSCLSYGRP